MKIKFLSIALFLFVPSAKAAIQLNGGNYVVIATNSACDFNGPVTLSCWVYPTISNNYQCLIAKTSAANVRQYGMYLSGNGTGFIYVDMDNGSGSPGNMAVSPGWVVNAWNNVIVTADGTTVRVYLGGVQVGSSTNSRDALNTASNVYLGMDVPDNSYGLIGYIDDCKIYNRALSAQEISIYFKSKSRLYLGSNPSVSTAQGIVGYWRLDDSKPSATIPLGSQLLDYSGYGNFGVLKSTDSLAAFSASTYLRYQ